MRFSAIIAASAVTILSVVSAQASMPSTPNIEACGICLNNAGYSAVPVCKGLEGKESKPNTPPTATHKACWCGLKSTKNWSDSCVGPDKCTAGQRASLVGIIDAAVAQAGFCDNVSTTSAGFKMSGVSSAKVAAAGAAMAVVGALL
ncbi:MAG: hypothetical protein J3R72DRAFT_449976 [Linnemannia gamsii]|nr:MAG: hypothetical protein J3R72DRAFT_449976 [Linnemannia gamsii]